MLFDLDSLTNDKLSSRSYDFLKEFNNSLSGEAIIYPHNQVETYEGHFHLYPELTLQLEGKSELSFSGETCLLAPGTVCIAPPLTPHQGSLIPGEPHYTTLLIHPVEGGIYFQVASSRFSDGRIAKVFKIREMRVRENIYSNDQISCQFDLLTAVMKRNYSSREHQRVAIMAALKLYLVDLLEVLKLNKPASQDYSLIVHQALHYLTLNYKDPTFDVQYLASLCRCTPNYLSALFYRETKQKIIAKLNSLRLEHACLLLRQTHMAMAEIALASGYSSATYFNRAFKNKYSQTPTKFRSGKI